MAKPGTYLLSRVLHCNPAIHRDIEINRAPGRETWNLLQQYVPVSEGKAHPPIDEFPVGNSSAAGMPAVGRSIDFTLAIPFLLYGAPTEIRTRVSALRGAAPESVPFRRTNPTKGSAP